MFLWIKTTMVAVFNMRKSPGLAAISLLKEQRIPILLIAFLFIIFSLVFLSKYFLNNPTNTTTITKIETHIDLSFTYGISQVKEQLSNENPLSSNGDSFIEIEARVAANDTLSGVNPKGNSTLQVLFDNSIKKQINLTLNNSTLTPETIGTIKVTSTEIRNWDASQNKTHTLIFRVPEDTAISVSTNEGNNIFVLLPSEKDLQVRVSIPFNPPSFTVSLFESYYVTQNSTGNILYIGSSASSAIQKAFDSVNPNQTILIKSAKYQLTDPIKLGQNNVSIFGENGTILQASTEMGSIFSYSGTSNKHASGLNLIDIVFDGNLKSAGLSIKWSDSVMVEGVTVENTVKVRYNNGIDFFGTSGSVVKEITVRNCTIQNIYGSGIYFAYSTDCTMSNNTFVDCAQYYPSGGAIHADDGCQRFTIQNNDISGRSDNDGIYMGTSRYFASGCFISGNTISLRLYGAGGGAAYAGSGIKIYTINSEVTGNTINWNGTPYVYGISNWGQNNIIKSNRINNSYIGIGDNIGLYYNGKNIIIDNEIMFSDYGIMINQRGSLVSTNIIEGTLNDGIIVYGATTEIDNNTIINCGQDSSFYGIKLEFGANNCNLYNNTITSNTGSQAIGDNAKGTTYQTPKN
jgi:parallel beta-helix repeat protein